MSVAAAAQGSSTNPSNPGNWQINRVDSGNGEDKRWLYNTATGTSTFSEGALSTAKFILMADGPYPKTFSASCSGTVTFKVKWIGSGAGPNKVVVRLNSQCLHPEGIDSMYSGGANPGLPISDVSGSQEGTTVSGEAFRELTLTNKEATTWNWRREQMGCVLRYRQSWSRNSDEPR